MKKRLGQVAIETTPGTLAYTVPVTPITTYAATLTCIDIANTTASSKTVSVHIVPVGDAVGTSNALLYLVAIDAYTTLQWTGEQGLDSGDYIQVVGSLTGLTATISGDEFSI